MNCSGKSSQYPGTQPTFKNWITRLFCLGEGKSTPSSDKENKAKVKPKQVIHLSLLGSYKGSTLCKISRKNFIADQREV